MKLFKVLPLVLFIGVVIGLVTFRSVKAQSTQQPYVLQITSDGTSSFVESVVGVDGVSDPELDAGVDFTDDGGGDMASAMSGAVINRTVGQGTGQGPSVNGGKKPKSNPVLNQSFDGLNFRQQRVANNGNQFSVEPPDQGLCVSNTLNTSLTASTTKPLPGGQPRAGGRRSEYIFWLRTGDRPQYRQGLPFCHRPELLFRSGHAAVVCGSADAGPGGNNFAPFGNKPSGHRRE